MRPAVVFAGAAACVLAALYLRQAQAANVQDNSAPESETDSSSSSDSSVIDQVNPFAIMDRNTIAQNLEDANAAAFLSAIAWAEGTDRVRADGRDPYGVCYSYRHQLEDYSDHPAITGEWLGESLANLGPSYAGKISTAAGRYQIIKPTWLACKRALGLTDFSPASQDAAALYLVRQRGALDLVRSGDFDQAVTMCAPVWASLPGSNAPGQPMRRLDALRTAFVDAGGTLA